MKGLPTRFRRDGFEFEQVLRHGDLAIYAKTKGAWKGFEVIRIRRRGAGVFKGKPFDAREVYPPNEAWGTHGFSCMDYPSALIRLAKMRGDGSASRPRRENAPTAEGDGSVGHSGENLPPEKSANSQPGGLAGLRDI